MLTARQDDYAISVLIPARGGASGLEKTLAGLEAQQLNRRTLNVLVANDGDDPAVTGVCRRHGVSMVSVSPRRGSYFARNRALERAAAGIVVFLDAGVIVPEGWLCAVVSALRAADYLACAIDIETVPRATAAEAYETAHAFPVAAYLRDSHFGVTAGLAVKKKVLEEIGAFDERLFSGGDLEFGDRVHRAGYAQALLSRPALLHPPRRAFSLFRKQFRARFGHRCLSRFYPERFPPRHRFTLIYRFLLALLPPRPGSLHREFPSKTTVPLWRRFTFLWSFKICRAAADLVATLIPSPDPPRKPTRIDWENSAAHGR